MRGENNAPRWISELSDRIGMAGWAALAVTPALLAEVDQHGAAARVQRSSGLVAPMTGSSTGTSRATVSSRARTASSRPRWYASA